MVILAYIISEFFPAHVKRNKKIQGCPAGIIVVLRNQIRPRYLLSRDGNACFKDLL